MNTIQKTLVACAVASLCGITAGETRADEIRSFETAIPELQFRHGCSLRSLAGEWLFATSIGRQMLPDLPADKDITALGTMVIERDGSVSGTFDVTIEDTVFIPGVGYEGSVVINRDCTGTLSFVNDFGAARSDSIAFINHREIVGMSQDPQNLWTYKVHRVGYISRRYD